MYYTDTQCCTIGLAEDPPSDLDNTNAEDPPSEQNNGTTEDPPSEPDKTTGPLFSANPKHYLNHLLTVINAQLTGQEGTDILPWGPIKRRWKLWYRDEMSGKRPLVKAAILAKYEAIMVQLSEKGITDALVAMEIAPAGDHIYYRGRQCMMTMARLTQRMDQSEMYKLMIRCLEGILAVEHFLQSAAWAQFFFVGHLASGEYWEIPELKADDFELVPGVQRSCMDLQVIYESYAKAFAELSVRCVNGINRVAPHLHLRITARFNISETDRITAGTFAAYKNSITAIMDRNVPEAGVLDDEIVETLNMAKIEDLKRKTITDEHTLVPTYVVPRFTKKSCTRIHITM